ncbi:MAG: hypothetical protein ABIT16_08800 [Croceibacterium sp.]
MTEAKRTQLKKKVAAGQQRNQDRGRTTMVDRAGERAIEAKDKFAAFAKEHPIATIAGGLAIGVLVSGLFKRSPTRKLGAQLGSRAAGFAAIGTELALAFAQQAMETAEEAGRTGAVKLEGLSETLGGTARSASKEAMSRAADFGQSARVVGREAAGLAGDLSETARDVGRDAGKRFGKVLRDRFN